MSFGRESAVSRIAFSISWMANAKAHLRARIGRLRRALRPASRERAERRIHGGLAALAERLDSLCVGVYSAMGGEVSVTAIAEQWLQAGLKVVWPRVEDDRLVFAYVSRTESLVSGYRDIREPPKNAPVVALGEIDCLVVPGLAFDRHGGRLGQGGGFYDRLLASKEWHGATCGVGYACQVVPRIPTERHDIALDWVVTDQAIAHEGTWRAHPN